MIEDRVAKLKDIIKKKGMKYTEQRELILRAMEKTNGHLNADEVYDIVKKEYPEHSISVSTIYRALNFLEEVGLISSISFGKDGKKFEKFCATHHDHLICIKCSKIIEFISDTIEKEQEKIAKTNKFKLTSHSLQLFGICSECQE